MRALARIPERRGKVNFSARLRSIAYFVGTSEPKSVDIFHLAVFVVGLLVLSQPVCAAAITVEGDAPLKSMTVTVEGATLNEVVQALKVRLRGARSRRHERYRHPVGYDVR